MSGAHPVTIKEKLFYRPFILRKERKIILRVHMQHHFLVLSFLQKRRLHINVDLFRYSYLLSYFLGQFIFDFLGGLRNLFGPTVFQLSAGNLEFDLHFSQILNHSILVLQKSLDNDFDLAADFRLFS